MGMFKRMKDMRDMVEAAPGMVAQAQQLGAQAQQLGAQAQQMAAAQQAAYQAQAGQAFGAQPGGLAEGAGFDPIAGVSIEQFASVSKGVAAFGYDPAKLRKSRPRRGSPPPTGRPHTRGGMSGSSGTGPWRSASTSFTGRSDMGVFKSMRDLQKQAKQIEATMPPVADRMAAAQARMAAANQMMAAQTQAANAAVAAAAGTAGAAAARRTVTIIGMRQIGMMKLRPAGGVRPDRAARRAAPVPGHDAAVRQPDADREASARSHPAGLGGPVEPGGDLAGSGEC